MAAPPERERATLWQRLRAFVSVYRYVGRAVPLVWQTNRSLTLALLALSIVGGLLPAGIAYTGKLIVDQVLLAARTHLHSDQTRALIYIGVELGFVISLAAAQRGIDVCRSLLRAQLGHRINVLILEKALTLDLTHFEDSDFYDKMTRARREASSRPLALVMRTFGLLQDGIALATYGALLLAFSPLLSAVLVVAALPAFIAETRFSGEAFRLFRWRTPETREQMYLETVLAREDHAKEVTVFSLGPRLLDRYRAIFERLYREDRNLTLRRGLWGYLLALVSTAAFFAAYGWIAISAIASSITLGQMTMYVLVFKQGQSALSSALMAVGRIYEDNLYVSNLYEFLDEPVETRAEGVAKGPTPDDGLRFEDVAFRYPGSDRDALQGVSLHIRPGQKLALVGANGSGKTTLIKLLTRLYSPTRGRVLLDGLDLREWDQEALRRRVGVIFQDFIRYQLTVGENIGAGDTDAFDDEARWRTAADKGLAAEFIEPLPRGYNTQLGRWFNDGREL
ncbi:MAG: ABC transporter ATP-binding protein, partial [Myxococcales bacterium]|nr:ABC transporter ATP-binding protein [Myxococcales bacterium]